MHFKFDLHSIVTIMSTDMTIVCERSFYPIACETGNQVTHTYTHTYTHTHTHTQVLQVLVAYTRQGKNHVPALLNCC